MVHGIYLEERKKKANEAPKKTRPNVEPLSFSLLGSEHQCLPQQGCSQKEVKGRKRENVVPFFVWLRSYLRHLGCLITQNKIIHEKKRERGRLRRRGRGRRAEMMRKGKRRAKMMRKGLIWWGRGGRDRKWARRAINENIAPSRRAEQRNGQNGNAERGIKSWYVDIKVTWT